MRKIGPLSKGKNFQIKEHNNKRIVEIDGDPFTPKVCLETFYSRELLELNRNSNDVDEYFKVVPIKKQSQNKKTLQIILKYFYKAIDSLICKPLKIPVCGLLPTLRICLKKR